MTEQYNKGYLNGMTKHITKQEKFMRLKLEDGYTEWFLNQLFSMSVDDGVVLSNGKKEKMYILLSFRYNFSQRKLY